MWGLPRECRNAEVRDGDRDRDGILGKHGVLHLPAALICCVVAFMAFGVLGFIRDARFLAMNQLRLDRCVGKVAIELRAGMNLIEKSNLTIKATRIAIMLDPEPTSKTGLQALLDAEVLFQESILSAWVGRQVQWIASGGCDRKGDLPIPLTDLPWERDWPDFIGPQPLTWPVWQSKVLHIELRHHPRVAAADVEIRGGKDGVLLSDWKARWAPPGGASVY